MDSMMPSTTEGLGFASNCFVVNERLVVIPASGDQA
jgi:hypothetical protein